MATIFLDQFSGSGSINGHMPDVGLPNAEWADIGAPPAAQLSGGHLVAPEAAVTRIAAYEYLVMGEPQPIDLPLEGSYIITFRTGSAAALDAAGVGINLFAFTIRDNDGSTVSIRTSNTSGIFVLQGPLSSAFLDLLPETTYTLTWIYQANLDRFISSSNPGNTLVSIPTTRTSAPEGFAFAVTQLADIDELQVTDDVPPLPAEPADYLYDDFTGDGPMEGRTPDFTAIPGVTWTDTSLAGSAETLGGNMVVGSGVPTDGVASARYGNFASAMGGPLTGDIYSEFATGPDLSYPVGATGPVTLVEFRFSVSPGEPLAVTVVVNPDGSFSVLYGDMQTAPITLTTDNIYFLYLNYLETEHYFELFDNNLSAIAFSDTYAYTPTNPSAGYGATELSVNERAAIGYYEVFGLLQGEIINDTDGMDDGVAEDATDTLNVATEDVVEAGVGEDIPLPDGEVLPEDAREEGVANDMADTQNIAVSDVQDNGVAADPVLFDIDSSFFRDEFNGTGSIAGHMPDEFYGPAVWQGDALLSGGDLIYNPSSFITSSAEYGSQDFAYDTPALGRFKFTLNVGQVQVAQGQINPLLFVRVQVWGQLRNIFFQFDQVGRGSVNIEGTPFLVPIQQNKTYELILQFDLSAITLIGFGTRTRVPFNGQNTLGFGALRLALYPGVSVSRVELSGYIPPEFSFDAFAGGVADDRALQFIGADVVEAAVAADSVDLLGGARLFVNDAADAGVLVDSTNTLTIINGLGRSIGVAADFAPNSYYAVPTETGVAADATSRTVLANQIALDAGIASDATDTRILEDAVAAGVAADATSLAVTLTVRDNGVATDRALPSMTIAADVREAGVAADAALPLSFVDVREAGIAEDVVATRRRTNQAARSDGVAVDSTDPRLAAGALAVAVGLASDATNTQLVAYSTVIEAGVGDDAGLFGRLYEAWVMNTQTSAMSRYTALPFNSAAVIGGRVIGLGDSGFFELGGTTDAGKPIKALMKSGHLTLQSDNVKRLDDMTVGYTSTGTLQVTVGAYGGPLKGRWTYTAPPVAAVSPRGNRLTLGRGLQAKYYQFTIENTKGAAMSLDFARVISNEFKTRRF